MKEMILDGAMGTMIQRYSLTEADFGKGRVGCNDVLSLTRPDVISEIHKAYIAAGADLIETNSFNANSISLEEYGLQDSVRAINIAAARLAREAADSELSRKVMVVGSMGPSNVALSLPEVAGARGVDFDIMRHAYAQQASALIEGGVDILLLETIFDTLNAKAAIAGIEDAFDSLSKRLPLMISVTLTEQGRTLSGQTIEAFMAAIRHSRSWSFGMNCGFGPERMAEWLPEIQRMRGDGALISLHPNAGLPDELGNYNQTPRQFAETMHGYIRRGLIDIAGGCCGTTPEHIAALSQLCNVDELPDKTHYDTDIPLYSGLKRCRNKGFIKVGERCNVAGSRKFLRLVSEGKLNEALDIGASQIEKRAEILDINMDDAMLDSPVEMERFVRMLGQDGRTANVPLMIDSSDMEVIRRALKHIQGRPIVNSISLKEGEEKFIEHARELHRLGAAVVVMAFDEKGQATTLERRIEICRRAYELLTERVGFRGEEIIFDPNILTIATGMPEHDRYALDFLEAVGWIKRHLPGAKVSGGVSNLSFAFRGNNRLREAMHSIFLRHAIDRGMDMAIVNPSIKIDEKDIDAIPLRVREAIEDVIFMRRPDATERLLEIAAEIKAEDDAGKGVKASTGQLSAHGAGSKSSADTIESRIEHGMGEGIEELLERALQEEGSAMKVVNNRLMTAMKRVGDEFGAGRMFLPQVVRSASVMKRSIDFLTPFISRESKHSGGVDSGMPFVLATVKGDVHDIGKNIVAVILKCGGFDVIDLGVMVEEDKILKALRESGAKFLGLSGLITPSLKEMQRIAEMLEREGLKDVTLCIGGATTSELHTAVRIAPLFSGITLHTRDAAMLPVITSRIADPVQKMQTEAEIRDGQRRIRREYSAKSNSADGDNSNYSPYGLRLSESPMPAPKVEGIRDLEVRIAEVRPLINWRAFLHTWRMSPNLANPDYEADAQAREESDRLLRDAERLIEILSRDDDAVLTARAGVVKARRGEDAIFIEADGGMINLPTPRKEGKTSPALSDFIAKESDWIGLFAVTAKKIIEKGEKLLREETLPDDLKGEYGHLLLQSIADRLVEAATEVVHTRVHEDLWGLSTPRGIRPAIGYSCLPDQSAVFLTDKILDYSRLGVSLTENGALAPSSTTTGLIIASPIARYF